MNPSKMFVNKEISNRDKFGVWLKTTREEHGYSARELAGKIGITASYLCDIEKGNRHAPLNHLDTISQIFNLPERELIYLQDLAGCSRGYWLGINEYLANNKGARDAMRAARNANLSDEEFLEIFMQILNNEQRKDFIDEILYLADDTEKESFLSWLSTTLTEEQINSYIQLSADNTKKQQENQTQQEKH